MYERGNMSSYVDDLSLQICLFDFLKFEVICLIDCRPSTPQPNSWYFMVDNIFVPICDHA